MKLAQIGTGKMGSAVAAIAREQGHMIAAVIDSGSAGLDPLKLSEMLKGADAAIDFSTASAVRRNLEACTLAGLPLVEGTTGWLDEIDDIRAIVSRDNGSFVYGANFSIGVNLFYRITEFAAGLFAKFPEYEAFIEEQHHSRKKDAPSGTALKIREIVSKELAGSASDEGVRVPIAATRAGNIPGTHRVGFDGSADQILLEHTARSREGFAFGAIMAAEWIVGKKGFYEFPDVIDEILSHKPSK